MWKVIENFQKTLKFAKWKLAFPPATFQGLVYLESYDVTG